MDANTLLSQMEIPEPCPMDWDAMRGDSRARYCESCGKHVHDLTAMHSDEAAALLQGSAASICGRVFKDADGSLSTSAFDGPIQPAARPWQFQIRTLMGLIAGVATVLGFARLFASPDGPIAVRKAPVPASRVRLIMGKMVPRQLAPPTANSQSCAPPASTIQ
jgi:hypothetical protein